jgi:hypothetical protein
MALYCVRQVFARVERQKVSAQSFYERNGMPVMDPAEVETILKAWFDDFSVHKTCQTAAVRALRDKYYPAGSGSQNLSKIHREEFLRDEVLKAPVLTSPSQHDNKCRIHNPWFGSSAWPTPPACKGEDCPENRTTQFECLCRAKIFTENEDDIWSVPLSVASQTLPNPDSNTIDDLKPFNLTPMFDCFDQPDKPSPSCAEDTEEKRENRNCLDEALDSTTIQRDDFDLMAQNYMLYVQAALQEETIQKRKEDQWSRTRCPLGTITEADGLSTLSSCRKRQEFPLFTLDNMEIIVGRVNPVNINQSQANYTRRGGNLEVEEETRYVYAAEAKSVFLITFDVRHLPQKVQYGKDWRIRFFLNKTLNPMYDDPIQCDTLLAKDIPGQRGLVVLNARKEKCIALEAPHALREEAKQEGYHQNASITFLLFPRINCEWRVEVQILNGVYLPDRFMFAQTAIVEEMTPQRALVDTHEAFAAMIKSDLKIELPYNLPLKLIPAKGVAGKTEMLQEAYLNWLPLTGPLTSAMRHPRTTNEYFFREKLPYFKDSLETLMGHLPYFSNCRGFGKTMPMWAVLEQTRGCTWEHSPTPIGLLSIGQEASGDKCSGQKIECILDETPNVKMTNPRWFEATTGSTLFHVTTNPMTGSKMAEKRGRKGEVPTVPVHLKKGSQAKGDLPTRVVVAFQYWQRTDKKKYLANGRVWYLDLKRPNEETLRGNQIWNYTLEVLYYPMSHFEVMVNFAFPMQFYFVLYMGIGCICLGVMWNFWLFHRTFPDVRVTLKPKLFDMRFLQVWFVPLLKGTVAALVPCLIPIIFGLGLIRGEILMYKLPVFYECEEGQLEDTCQLGCLDWVQSSYIVETPVTITTPGQRRTGRTGTGMAVMGAYAVIQVLKLLIPGQESSFYDKEASDNDPNKPDEDSEASSEYGTQAGDEGKGSALEKIFNTHLWKRSCLALVMFGNAVAQQAVLQYSFSNFFRDYSLYLLITLYLIIQTLNAIYTNFMCETLLIIPINNVNQVIFLACLLAAPTLFDFIVQYLAMLAIQIMNRIYISPNRDKVLANVLHHIGRVWKTIKTIMKHHKPEEQAFDGDDDDDPVVVKVRNDALAAAYAAAHEQISDEMAEDMITFLGDMTTDVVGNIMTPVFFILCRAFYHESKILNTYNVLVEDAFYYIFFYAIQLVFQFMIDALSINAVELYHGWHVLDYFEYCQYRFKTRSQDWKGRGQSYDETVPPHMRSLDQFCFSEQFVFVCILATAGMLTWMIGMQIIFVNKWNVFDDPATSVVLFGSLLSCVATHRVTMIVADYLGIWKVRVSKDVKQLALDELFMDRRADEGGQAPLAPKAQPTRAG